MDDRAPDGDSGPEFLFRPLDKERWTDFEALFGKNGACGGCWCMYWFQTGAQFEKMKGEKNRKAMQERVFSGNTPGLLAYAGDIPAGWAALSPRSEYPRLARSRVLAPVDDAPVWSVVCFFIHKNFRGRHLTVRLLEAAKTYAKANGCAILEGYPVDPKTPRIAPAFAFHGTASAFERAGFAEVLRRSETRPIMRAEL